MCGGHKLGVARSRAAKQEPPTCFGDFAAAKSGRHSVRTLLHDGRANPFTNGDFLPCGTISFLSRTEISCLAGRFLFFHERRPLALHGAFLYELQYLALHNPLGHSDFLRDPFHDWRFLALRGASFPSPAARSKETTAKKTSSAAASYNQSSMRTLNCAQMRKII